MAALATILATTTLGHLFKTPKAIVSFNHDVPISTVLETLSKHRILGAPVATRTANDALQEVNPSHAEGRTCTPEAAPTVKTVIGFVDVALVLQALLAGPLLKSKSNPNSADIEEAAEHLCAQRVSTLFGHTLSTATATLVTSGDAGRDWGLKGTLKTPLISVISVFLEYLFTYQYIPSVLSRRDNLLQAEPTVHGVHSPRARQVIHRVLVFDCAEGPDEADPHVLGVLSQSDVVRFLYEHADAFGPDGNKTLEQLGLAKQSAHDPAHRQVISVSEDMITLEALRKMNDVGVSAVAVVGSDGKLVSNLSTSDLRCLAPGLFWSLSLPVKQFLASRPLLQQVQLETAEAAAPSIEEPHAPAATSTEAADPHARSPLGAASARSMQAPVILGMEPVPPPAITCHANVSLIACMGLLVKARVHRVYVADADGKVQAVVTLTDILRTVLKLCETAGQGPA